MDTKREHRAHAEGSPRGKPCDLSHSPSGRLIGKFRDNNSVTLSATVDIAYGYCDDYQPHAVRRMFNYKNGMLYDLRYGEPYVNQHPFGYSERFTFTGKAPRKGMRIPLNKIKYNEQRDEGKGRSGRPFASERADEARSGIPFFSDFSYTYFGARYMDHELMTMWLSVDPMSDKYPSMSPYHYCHWNPIVMVDYDGRWDIKVTAYKDRGKCAYATFVVYDKNQNEIYRTIVKVQGTSHKKNDYKPRDRHKKNADTPTGKYKIKMWKKMSPSVSYGPNPALILEYEGGECTPQERNGIYVHGGRQEGEYKGRQYLSSTYGCFRIKDEDLVELKKIVDGLVDDPMGMLILEDGMSDDMANDINKQLPTLMTDHQKRTTYGNEPDSLIPFLEDINQLFDSFPLSVPDATRVEIKYIPNQF